MRNQGSRGMGQQLRAYMLFQRTEFDFQYPCGNSQPPVTPVSRTPTPSSGLHRLLCACTQRKNQISFSQCRPWHWQMQGLVRAWSTDSWNAHSRCISHNKGQISHWFAVLGIELRILKMLKHSTTKLHLSLLEAMPFTLWTILQVESFTLKPIHTKLPSFLPAPPPEIL